MAVATPLSPGFQSFGMFFPNRFRRFQERPKKPAAPACCREEKPPGLQDFRDPRSPCCSAFPCLSGSGSHRVSICSRELLRNRLPKILKEILTSGSSASVWAGVPPSSGPNLLSRPQRLAEVPRHCHIRAASALLIQHEKSMNIRTQFQKFCGFSVVRCRPAPRPPPMGRPRGLGRGNLCKRDES
jgi:hypothetical protein